MFANLNGWHLIILLAVVLLLFGATKLPALAKSVGQSARILKGEIRESRAEDPTPDSDAPSTGKNSMLAEGGVSAPRPTAAPVSVSPDHS